MFDVLHPALHFCFVFPRVFIVRSCTRFGLSRLSNLFVKIGRQCPRNQTCVCASCASCASLRISRPGLVQHDRDISLISYFMALISSYIPHMFPPIYIYISHVISHHMPIIAYIYNTEYALSHVTRTSDFICIFNSLRHSAAHQAVFRLVLLHLLVPFGFRKEVAMIRPVGHGESRIGMAFPVWNRCGQFCGGQV